MVLGAVVGLAGSIYIIALRLKQADDKSDSDQQ
jgi:hypothetical protein